MILFKIVVILYRFLLLFDRKYIWTCSIMDSAPDYGSGGWGFDSLQVHFLMTLALYAY